MSFFEELKRRNVFRVGIAYAVSAWVLLQVVDLVLENITAPEWVMQIFMLALAIGFPVALIFAWAFEMTPEGVKLEKHVDRSQSITQVTGQKMNRGIIVALTIAVVFLLVDRFTTDSDTDPQPAVESVKDSEVLAVDAETIEKSIAVLPFVNMSSDPEQDYFADGISEEILNALASVSDLKVAGRTSSFAFKGKNEDLLAIGKVLRVNHILEGSVRKSGNRVRITAQLIKVDDGFHMWSETWDREIDDIFVIQDEISAAILTQLKTQLLGEQLVTAHTNTRAYELYLLSKQHIHKRTQDSLEMAVKLLDEAITTDSSYAPSFAQLGIAYLLLSDDNYGTLPNETAGEKAKINLDTALQLDPQNAEALAGMGLYFSNNTFEHEKTVEMLQKALTINPNLINASTWLSTELRSIGDIRAAREILEQTVKRDPLHAPSFGNLQMTYMIMGQEKKAREMLDGLQAYLPGDAELLGDYAEVNLMTGQLSESLQLFQQAHEKEPLNTVSNIWYGLTLNAARQYTLAAEIAPGYVATLALSRLGRTEEALILGKQATSGGQVPYFYFQALAENGRFAELIQILESRWPDLDAFVSDWPGRRGWGNSVMGTIAQAYRNQGDEEKFEDAMKYFKSSLDAQIAEGADNMLLTFSRAYYAVLANDYEAAISLLEKAFQQGAYLDTSSKTAWPVFKVLDGDPRYEAAKKTMNARLQEELAKGSGSFTQETIQSNDIAVAE